MQLNPNCRGSIRSITVALAALGGLMPLAFAADEQSSCFADIAETHSYTLGLPSHMTPTPDGKSVLYLRSGPRDTIQRLYEFDVATGTERELITPEQLLQGAGEHLSDEEKARRERQRITVRGFVGFELSRDGAQMLLSLGGRLFSVDRADRHVTSLPGAGWIAPHLSPDGKRVAALRDGEIHVIEIKTGTDIELTHGATPTLTHGEAEFVAQEEMDRPDGFWWSPDSRSLAYEEADLSDVEIHYVADPLHPAEAPVEFRYPRAGTKNAKLRLGVINAAGGTTRWIPWDNSQYPYLARVTWGEGGPLTLVIENRAQTEEQILAADPTKPAAHLLWTERDPDWLELPQVDFPRWRRDGSGFLWATERNGQWQLELHAPDGKLIRALTPTEFRFDQLLDDDPASGQLVVDGSTDRLSREIWSVAASGGAPVKLTAARGLHSAGFGDQHGLFAHRFTLADGTQGADLIERDGKRLAVLPSHAATPPFIPNVEYLTVGERGFDALVVRPRDFNPKRHYPVILSEYAGPAAKMVMASPRQSFERQCIADRGFIVVTLDNRGTPGRDRAWLRAVRSNAIDIPLQDQIDGLLALAQHVPQMDLKRVGVEGWSFGGYFAAMATMRRPDIFAAGVAGAPVVDWQDYDTTYTERYLEHPEQNPDGYRISNVLTYVDQLRRPLLLVHGVTDDNVYFENTLKLTGALLSAGKPYELLLMPGTHMLSDPVLRQRESERVVEFMQQHLGAAPSP